MLTLGTKLGVPRQYVTLQLIYESDSYNNIAYLVYYDLIYALVK